ncbi:MAG: flippase [Elusimicrobia bacterium]|nr:flippase [Elusimicrobiota bacterium]
MRRIFANARVLFLTEVMNLVAGIAAVILLARFLDVAALGLYSFSYALGSVVAIACLYGANQLIVREVARSPGNVDALLGNSIATRAAVGLALMLGLEALFVALGYSRERMLIVSLLVLARLFDSLIFMFCSFFRGRQEMKYEGILRVCLNVASVGLSLPVLLFSRSLLIFSAIQCGASLVIAVVSYRVVSRRYGSAPFAAVSWEASRTLFLDGLSFSLYGILLVLFLQTNTILLTLFKGDDATGFYTAGYRFISALGMAATSVTGAVYPVISKLNLENHAGEIRRTYLRCLRYLWALALYVALGLYWFAPEVIGIVYGSKFLPAVPGLRIMSAAVLFSYANSAATSVLFSLNQEREVVRTLGYATVFVALINLILLPPLGHLGASLTTLIPEVFSFCLLLGVMKKSFRRIDVAPLAARFGVVALAVSAGAAALAGRPLWLRIAVFSLSYAAAIVAAGVLGSEELKFLFPKQAAPPEPEAVNA